MIVIVKFCILSFMLGFTLGIYVMYRIWLWKRKQQIEAWKNGATDI
jgi:hypothetical protein